MGLPKKKLKMVPLLGILTEAIVMKALCIKMKPRKPFYRKKKLLCATQIKVVNFLIIQIFARVSKSFSFLLFFGYLFCVFINNRYTSIYGFNRHAY